MSLIQLRVSETVFPLVETSTLEYRVRFEVVLAQNISPNLFVFMRDGDVFSHPATLFDLNLYPDAPSTELDFYRKSFAELAFADIKKANEATVAISGRLKQTVLDWAKVYQLPFGGTKLVTFDSERP